MKVMAATGTLTLGAPAGTPPSAVPIRGGMEVPVTEAVVPVGLSILTLLMSTVVDRPGVELVVRTQVPRSLQTSFSGPFLSIQATTQPALEV